MDAPTVELTIKSLLRELRDRVDKAAAIAKAAEARADSGNVEKGIEIALDLEQLTYEINMLLNAGTMINRMGQT